MHHAFTPGTSGLAVEAIATALTRPCFHVLTRVSATRLGGRMGFTRLDARMLEAYLARVDNETVLLDSGRNGAEQAVAQIHAGRLSGRSGLQGAAPLLSYLVVPVVAGEVAEVLDAICELAVALQVVAGGVTVERTFEAAEAFAHGAGRGEAVSNDLDTRIPAPAWGLFLSGGHLRVIPAAVLNDAALFSRVRQLVSGQLVFVQVTDNPVDALAPEFERRLREVGQALEPMSPEDAPVEDRAEFYRAAAKRAMDIASLPPESGLS